MFSSEHNYHIIMNQNEHLYPICKEEKTAIAEFFIPRKYDGFLIINLLILPRNLIRWNSFMTY